jgi:hypothetical protein
MSSLLGHKLLNPKNFSNQNSEVKEFRESKVETREGWESREADVK